MITKIDLMEKDTIFYLYATWHVSIFVSFCGILHADNVNFKTFVRVAHLPKEFLLLFYFEFY